MLSTLGTSAPTSLRSCPLLKFAAVANMRSVLFRKIQKQQAVACSLPLPLLLTSVLLQRLGRFDLLALNCIFGPVFHLSVPPDMLEPAHECSLIEAG